MEVLSEHLCEGWLEGYLLTGRHGFFSCYEAFIHIVDSMFNQHAKWLKVSREIPWRRPIASLNYLLTSHVWRQDHNGFSHQDPGLHRSRREQEGGHHPRLPAAGCQHAAVRHRCLPALAQLVNVIVAGKNAQPQWLDIDAAIAHCARGIGIWEWASNDAGGAPDLVMACAGDVPTIETLAAVDLLRQHVAGAARARRQRRRPDDAAAARGASARALATATSTRSSRPTSRSSSPITAIRG